MAFFKGVGNAFGTVGGAFAAPFDGGKLMNESAAATAKHFNTVGEALGDPFGSLAGTTVTESLPVSAVHAIAVNESHHWKYEIRVLLCIAGAFTGPIQSYIVSEIKGPAVLKEIKKAFCVKGRDFCCEAVQRVSLDQGLFSTNVTIVICVTLDRKGLLHAYAKKVPFIGKAIGKVVSIDKRMKKEVKAGYDDVERKSRGIAMTVKSVDLCITQRGS